MDTHDCIGRTLSELESLYHEMDKTIEKPIPVNMNGHKCVRYKIISDPLACFMKGVSAVSSSNAALILLKIGYTKEFGALCRIIDECCNDIFFLVTLEGDDKLRKDKIQFLNDFFQEEFDKPMGQLGSTQK